MAKRFIMTAFAQDRVGLAADITKIIYENGCNLDDTAMIQLENEFVLMLLLTGEDYDLADQLAKECRRLEREKNITAFIRELNDNKEKSPKSVSVHKLHIEGVDQAGIVYKISTYLAKLSINISKLISKKLMSPETGTTIYVVEMEIEVPAGRSLDELEQGLLELGQEMDIEFNIDEK